MSNVNIINTSIENHYIDVQVQDNPAIRLMLPPNISESAQIADQFEVFNPAMGPIDDFATLARQDLSSIGAQDDQITPDDVFERKAVIVRRLAEQVEAEYMSKLQANQQVSADAQIGFAQELGIEVDNMRRQETPALDSAPIADMGNKPPGADLKADITIKVAGKEFPIGDMDFFYGLHESGEFGITKDDIKDSPIFERLCDLKKQGAIVRINHVVGILQKEINTKAAMFFELDHKKIDTFDKTSMQLCRKVMNEGVPSKKALAELYPSDNTKPTMNERPQSTNKKDAAKEESADAPSMGY